MNETEQQTTPADATIQPNVQQEAAPTAPTPEAPTAPVPEEPTPETVAAAAVTASAQQTLAEDPAPSAAPTAEEDKPDDSTIQPVSAPVAEKADTQPVASAECAAPVAAPEADTATTKALADLKTTADSIAESIRLLCEATAKLDARLATLEGQTSKLMSDFSARLRFDEVKDQVIVQQNKELDGYRRGGLAREISSLVDNLIMEIDGTRRIADHMAQQEVTETSYKKVVAALMDAAEALEDSVLSRVSIKPYKTAEGAKFDPVRHIQAKAAHDDTNDPAKDGLVSRSVRCGYERTAPSRDGNTEKVVIRPEQVAIWRHVAPTSSTQKVFAESASAEPSSPSSLQSADSPVETPAV